MLNGQYTWGKSSWKNHGTGARALSLRIIIKSLPHDYSKLFHKYGEHGGFREAFLNF